MTAYMNLRNVLADMLAADFFGDGVLFADADVLMDRFHNATTALEDSIYSKCRTVNHWDTAMYRIERDIRKAARVVSKNDPDFIVAVLSWYYDADFYGITIYPDKFYCDKPHGC